MPISMKTYNFTLRQIQYMVAVADALSFRSAAERCNVSQPSLSAQIAEMEAALQFSKYDVKTAWGHGGHSGNHGGAVLPDALRWLWR